MARCVIVGGAGIRDYRRIREALCPEDYLIFCDSGLRHEAPLGRTPDLIVGDFDSYEKPVTAAEVITLPREKDDTDTVFAVKEAIKRGYTDFLLIGVIGERFDHSFGNIALLLMLEEQGCTGKILDDYSEMELVTNSASVDDRWAYFSLLTMGGDASGIYIRNAKFPLRDAVITGSYQYGVSNESLPGKTAEITVAKGKLLLVKIFR